jgi:acyl-CoA synthetase (AMP-forming)/AMP-acid ligase II
MLIAPMRTFRSVFDDHLARRPDFAWLTLVAGAGETPVTIRQLAERTCDYAAFYRERGVAEGDTVVIILRESLDLFAAFFAGLITGALPAFYYYPSPKQSVDLFLKAVENLLLYNEVKVIVSYPQVIGILKGHHPIAVPEFIGFFAADEVPRGGSADFSAFHPPAHEAFLQFSSGTTGAKKGVKISARALFNQVDAYAPCVAHAPGDRIVSWLPHYHDMGLIACMLMPFALGVPIHMMSPFEWVRNPRLLLDWISRVGATHVWLPNFALSHMAKSVAEDELAGLDLSSLKRVVCCSEPVLLRSVEDFVGRFAATGLRPDALQNCFAMAENTFAMTSTAPGGLRFLSVDRDVFRQEHRAVAAPDGNGRTVASAGTPLANIRVKVSTPDGAPLPDGHVGEILIASDCMLDSYHNNWEETQRAFVDGWFKTGDLGFFHDGELFVTGRSKDMIIVGGENIYPQDIEAILNAKDYLVPGRNVVFGVEHEKTGTERVVVLAEASADVPHTSEDLVALSTEILNAVGVAISRIAVVPHMTLLKGTAGKISRYLNKQAYLDGNYAAK